MAAKKIKKRRGIGGLHLWRVGVEHDGFSSRIHTTLLITTPTKSIKRAIDKAASFLDRSEYENPVIDGAEHKGTLDA
jgi:hypothetical protein